MKKITLLLLVLSWSWAHAAFGQEEEESAKTLKDRIKSVSNRLYLKSGRLELTLLPLTSFSLNDAFFQKFGGGLQLAYHLSDAFAIQVMGTYSLNTDTGNATYHGSRPSTNIPYAGERSYLFAADLTWAPLYGKISLASEWTLHFDTYLLAGLGGIGGELQNASSFGFSGTFGLGARFFLTRTFALKLELMDFVVFTDKVQPDPTRADTARSDIQNQLLFNLGLSIFLFEGNTED